MELKEKIFDQVAAARTGEKTVNEATEVILALFGVMHRSFQGTNAYAIEHLINDTHQVVDRVDGTVYHQGTKRDCEVYLNGA